ncbi:MAG TPA: hypothetical protein VMD09_14885 [Solirubrobacteraceae bacterium]|nr:hypothetical protein [Solirubrobacteraceae bacterium]
MAVRPQRNLPVRRLAPLALMPVAAFAVHQLRYWLAFGGHAGAILQGQGHSYLHSVAPWLALLLALGVGIFLRALGRAFTGQSSPSRYTLSFAALWLLCAASLVIIYAAQELLEGLLIAGHPAGLIGVFGYGGWWAIPAALAIGLVLAAAFHGARWVLQTVADRYRVQPRAARRREPRSGLPVDAFLPRLAPLAAGASGRGPPR